MCGDITLEALREFDGRDPAKPLYLVRLRVASRIAWRIPRKWRLAEMTGVRLQACLGDVYDVTRGWDFYGPEGPYNKFAGR